MAGREDVPGTFETEIKTHHTPVLQRQNIWKFVKIKK